MEDPASRFCQQNGFMHAGAIASVADSANGYAALSLTPPETDVLAVDVFTAGQDERTLVAVMLSTLIVRPISVVPPEQIGGPS